MKDPESQDFVRQLKNQNNDAFTSLVSCYHNQMVSVAGAIAGSQWAEEAVQDAWIAIFQALPKFEGRSSLTPW